MYAFCVTCYVNGWILIRICADSVGSSLILLSFFAIIAVVAAAARTAASTALPLPLY